MNTVLTFLNKWGLAIITMICITIFFNTCGVKGNQEQLEKKVKSLEQTIAYQDSINKEINSIEREISMYETAREVVYTNNAIVRNKIERPDDIMNEYGQKIKALQIKRDKLNAARK